MLPALVRDVHQEYVRAGAEIIETNTFGANRKRLARSDLRKRSGYQSGRGPDRPRSRSGSGFRRRRHRTAGSAPGAAGVHQLRGSASDFPGAGEVLVEAGVDLLMLETFRDMNEVARSRF